MTLVTQEFESAPMGGRVVRSTVLAIAIVAVIGIVESGLFLRTLRHSAVPLVRMLPPLGAAFIALVVMVWKFFYERTLTSRFRIEDNVLILGKKRYPLEHLTEATRDPDAMSWAFRIAGNGGLGSIRGRFWSKRLGKFDAFLTSTPNAVLLRWPTARVVVSPADSEFFIQTARRAADLP